MIARSKHAFKLVLSGAGSRITYAIVLVVALWAGFFWAISTPGGL